MSNPPVILGGVEPWVLASFDSRRDDFWESWFLGAPPSDESEGWVVDRSINREPISTGVANEKTN